MLYLGQGSDDVSNDFRRVKGDFLTVFCSDKQSILFAGVHGRGRSSLSTGHVHTVSKVSDVGRGRGGAVLANSSPCRR